MPRRQPRREIGILRKKGGGEEEAKIESQQKRLEASGAFPRRVSCSVDGSPRRRVIQRQ